MYPYHLFSQNLYVAVLVPECSHETFSGTQTGHARYASELDRSTDRRSLRGRYVRLPVVRFRLQQLD